jgi:uncharacterized protein (TIGR03000 family)
MYSVVLLMAMTGTPHQEAGLFNKGGGCQGCYGCQGCNGGCYGCSGCHGCYGNSCCGCNGGGGGGLFGKKRQNNGCCGCQGGCYGGCYGNSCCGCYGGGCYGGGCYGGGCYGGCWGGGGYMIDGGHMAPGAPPAGGNPPGGGAQPMPAPKPGTGMLAAPATIVVNLPADASLKFDETPTTVAGDPRTFASPELPVGQDYHYTLTATVTRNGMPLSLTQSVNVRGGQTSRVQFPAASFGQPTVALK